MFSRRDFLVMTGRGLPVLGGVACAAFQTRAAHAATVEAAGVAPTGFDEDLLAAAPRARYWAGVPAAGGDCSGCHTPADLHGSGHAHDTRAVSCLLCAQRCRIKPGQRGRCRARVNVAGELRSLVYGRPLAVHIDPIEKKPFYHFLPGASAYSLGTAGCPLRCRFCQNWQLSQASPEDHRVAVMAPAQVVASAVQRHAPVVAFTYNEPTVFIEYMLDTASVARQRGIHPVLVSCGFMNEAPLADLCHVLRAIKIDLKGYSEEFYRSVCDAELRPVLRSISQIARSGVHLELVNLVVPTLNDSDAALHGLIDWIAGELGPDVPVHFTQFHPDFQLLNLPPTPVATLERARDMALARGLHYPYVGNVPDHPGAHTYCPGCRKVVVRRTNLFVLETHLVEGRCEFCRRPIAGVWS
jgi:pyruvate formate lyase activating enzyme